MAWLDVKGHKDVVGFLVNAHKNHRLGHCFLFLGPEGIGKRRLAGEFAKFLLCEAPTEFGACGKCRSCLQVTSDNHPDLHIISRGELGWIKIGDIRALQSQIHLSPFSGKHKIFIIDNAHMLTQDAANSLLKFMEEPPPGAISVLITSQIDSIPETLVSRCQRLYFSSLSSQEIEETLSETLPHDRGLINFIARFSEGRLGRAISLIKRKDIQSAKNRLLRNIIDNNLALDDFAVNLNRENLNMLIEFTLLFFRDILLLKAGLGKEFLVNFDEVDTLTSLASKMEMPEIKDALEDILKAQALSRTNVNCKILLRWLEVQLQKKLRFNYA
ncbi:MAG: DNA polymerase III subunit delta' [Candidatus Omnitrophica bacterium]|nr:DNA polymerase III subunit delta' [Candidatus Omnitrophota bacterium]